LNSRHQNDMLWVITKIESCLLITSRNLILNILPKKLQNKLSKLPELRTYALLVGGEEKIWNKEERNIWSDNCAMSFFDSLYI